MFIGIRQLETLFKDDETCSVIQTNLPCLGGFLALSQADGVLNTHTLYLTDVFPLPKEAKTEPGMNYLVIQTKKDTFPEAEDCPLGVNFLFVKSVPASVVMQKLGDYFMEKVRISLFSETMLDALSGGSSLQDLVDLCYQPFENPVFVFDAAFYLLATNWKEAAATGYFDELLKNRWVSDVDFDFVTRMNSFHKRMLNSETPMRLKHIRYDFEQMISPIEPGKNIGHIVLCATNRPLIESDTELLVVFRKALSQHMRRDAFVQKNRGLLFESFIEDVLDEKLAIGYGKMDFMDYIRPNFPANLYCVVTEIARSTHSVNTFRVQKLFENALPNVQTLFYREQIVALVSYEKGQFMTESDRNALQTLCEKHHLYAGLSNCFFDILGIRDYYKQALRAIEMGVSQTDAPGLFCYRDFFLRHAAQSFARKESVQAFCHPALAVLLDYDRQKGTQLAKTLYLYLDNERSAAAAAAAIGIHRNTLSSRLKQIDALVRINYEDSRERRYLLLSYEFLMNTERG